MKKQDYSILAAAIKKHRGAVLGYSALDNAPIEPAKVAENIARTFARFASVDKPAFLKACGLE